MIGSTANRLSLTVRGSRTVAERAFRTQIRDYRQGGRSLYANVGGPVVPARLGSHVQTVIGLADNQLVGRGRGAQLAFMRSFSGG